MNSQTGQIDQDALSDSSILLSVQNPADRKLISERLPESYSLLEHSGPGIDRPFDLILSDYDSFREHRDDFVTLKNRALPIHLPLLLLVKNDRALKQNGQVWNMVDDVVEIPVPVNILTARIQNLLRTRRYSQKLQQSNRELQWEKDRYKLITENSTDVVTLHDLEGNYIYVSPASEDLFGYTPEELEGRNMYEFIHPDDRDKMYMLHEESLKKYITEIQRATYRLLTKSGGHKWVETTARIITGEESGQPEEIQATTRDITDRKKYEQQLREEKEFLNTVVDNMPGVFYMVDSDMNYVFWNRNLRELGYSDEEIAGMSPYDFFPEDEHERVSKNINRIITEGEADMEVDIIRGDGETVHYYLTGKRMTREGETYIVGSGVDITQRMEAEYKSEQQKRLLHAIINQSDSIIYVKDADGVNRLVNQKYLKLFGLTEEEVIGRTDREIHGDGYAEIVRENDRRVLETGSTIEVEENIPVGGTIRTYLSIKYPLKDIPGYENCVCGISTNITDRKKILSQLRERVKEQNCLYQVSSLTERGLSVEELLEKAVGYLPEGWQYPEIAEASIRFDGKTYETDNYTETPWTLSARSERIEDKPLEIRVSYLEPRPVVEGSAFLEEERQLIDTLADNISLQIDRILVEERIKQSLREKDVLLQEIHHRVKNNLAVVSSLLELQRMQSDNEWLNKILANSQMRIHSMGLIHEKLYQAESLSKINFRVYIDELASTITQTIDAMDRITLDLACEDITLNVNQAVPCALILNELISNAVEHAFPDQQPGTIQIRLKEKDDRIVATVKDNGVGIPEDFQHQEEQSMGYTIVETLISQLEAEYEMNTDDGTEITFSFQKQLRRGSSSNIMS